LLAVDALGANVAAVFCTACSRRTPTVSVKAGGIAPCKRGPSPTPKQYRPS
jgi:hypothetical protein